MEERDFRFFKSIGGVLIDVILQRAFHLYTHSTFVEILSKLKVDNGKTCDLKRLPTEVGIKVLKYLDATDLSLASCVWADLASDWSVWADLCKRTWKGPARLYHKKPRSWKELYLLLDEASLQFNADPIWGLNLLQSHNLIDLSSSHDIALFISGTNRLYWKQVRDFVSKRFDVLASLTALQNFQGQFMPSALRKFFSLFHVPKLGDRDRLEACLLIFSKKYFDDNDTLNIDAISIVSYAIVLLSVDLTTPQCHIRNKMSKREFIKNTLRALENAEVSCELFTEECGDYYDNIYLLGHIAPEKWD